MRGTGDGATHGRIVPCPGFRPAPWLPGPHLPTLWAGLLRRPPAVDLWFETLELPDGDAVRLVHAGAAAAPTVIVLHGLEGNHASPYARALLGLLAAAGFHGVLLEFRGCSGQPNRLDRSYHSGDTGDLAALVARLEQREGRAPFAVVGYSLGGNVLLKWLGELADAAPVSTAVAVSVPFDLAACAARLAQGFSRVYQGRLLRSLRRKYREKFAAHPNPPVALTALGRLRDFRAYDDAVIAPLHGFRDADDYYRQASCRPGLARITVPTLVIHALDDPFVPSAVVPSAAELAPAVTLELSPRGGHVGFVAGMVPGRPHYWCEPRIITHLAQALDPAAAPGAR